MFHVVSKGTIIFVPFLISQLLCGIHSGFVKNSFQRQSQIFNDYNNAMENVIKFRHLIKTKQLENDDTIMLRGSPNSKIYKNNRLDEVDIVLQVHKSHSDRLCDYIESGVYRDSLYADDGAIGGGGPIIVESMKRSKSVSVLYVSSRLNNSKQLAITMINDDNLTFALNKVFLVEKGSIIQGTLDTDVVNAVITKFKSISTNHYNDDDDDDETKQHDIVTKPTTTTTTTTTTIAGAKRFVHGKQKESTNHKIGVRLQLFPPKRQTSFLSQMEDSLNHHNIPIEFSPTSFSYVLSIVQVDIDSSNNSKDEHFLLGLTEFSELNESFFHGRRSGFKPSPNRNDDEVCRAYRKLDEAFRRYHFGNKNTTTSLLQSFNNSVALDCGAAPGGWTQFLLQQVKCQKVYSVDPGLLSPSILQLDKVEYMQMKIETAIQLLDQKQVKINLWVSDMCLQNMEDQLEMMIQAKEAGILADNSFFILTMKCFKGHSKAAYDEQVNDIFVKGKRFQSISTRDVRILHLFSNRKGERTVMGYIN